MSGPNATLPEAGPKPILPVPAVPEAGPKPAGANVTDVPPAAAGGNGTNEAGAKPAGSVGILSEFEQCGGAGGGCWAAGGESMCKDDVWPGKGCSSGLECVRQNFWYRQCLKADVVKNLGSAWVTTAPTAKTGCENGFVGFQQQCGGKGGQCASNKMLGGCADEAAKGVCCEPGTTCQRMSEWMWQCQGHPSSGSVTN